MILQLRFQCNNAWSIRFKTNVRKTWGQTRPWNTSRFVGCELPDPARRQLYNSMVLFRHHSGAYEGSRHISCMDMRGHQIDKQFRGAPRSNLRALIKTCCCWNENVWQTTALQVPWQLWLLWPAHYFLPLTDWNDMFVVGDLLLGRLACAVYV